MRCRRPAGSPISSPGSGTFAGPMLARGAVDVYENVAPTIRALDEATGDLPLKAIRRDLYREPLTREEAERYDAIVFDPPRAGAEAQVAVLAASTVPVLVGVSCNPVTFARDARILIDGGYRLGQRPGDRPVHLLASCRTRRGLFKSGLSMAATFISTRSARKATASAVETRPRLCRSRAAGREGARRDPPRR